MIEVEVERTLTLYVEVDDDELQAFIDVNKLPADREQAAKEWARQFADAAPDDVWEKSGYDLFVRQFPSPSQPEPRNPSNEGRDG